MTRFYTALSRCLFLLADKFSASALPHVELHHGEIAKKFRIAIIRLFCIDGTKRNHRPFKNRRNSYKILLDFTTLPCSPPNDARATPGGNVTPSPAQWRETTPGDAAAGGITTASSSTPTSCGTTYPRRAAHEITLTCNPHYRRCRKSERHWRLCCWDTMSSWTPMPWGACFAAT
jgi:hypothetical protein